jgi:hypothetical protein
VVRQWLGNYHKLREALDESCELNHALLRPDDAATRAADGLIAEEVEVNHRDLGFLKKACGNHFKSPSRRFPASVSIGVRKAARLNNLKAVMFNLGQFLKQRRHHRWHCRLVPPEEHSFRRRP